MRGSGLEPPWVTPLAPKASASTISPPAQTMTSIAKNRKKCEVEKEHGMKEAVQFSLENCTASDACPPTRARTSDLIVKSDLLYQLSYGRIGWIGKV